MTLLIDRTFPRTLDTLVERFAGRPGIEVEAWLFEDEGARRDAEERLRAHGVTARLRSAYKPLVHAVLEEIDLSGATGIDIAYPVHPSADERRFLLEAYPLAGLVAAPLAFEARDDGALRYDLTVRYEDRTPETIAVEAPNRVHTDHTGAEVLSPTGWLRVRLNDRTLEDARIETDFEALFAAGMAALGARRWGTEEPFFEELRIDARLPFRDRPLSFGQEALSLTEALHEEFYFSGLEFFQERSGRPSGDRGLQPGRIVPVIATVPGGPALRMELRAHAEPPVQPRRPRWTPLEADAPLNRAEIERALDRLGGRPESGRSVCGRPVEGRVFEGTDTPVLITAGQHPNEPTGIAGALRAGAVLADRPGAHFALVPLENPDGHALARELIEAQPHHMHHAARYTALGDDLEFRRRAPFHERDTRERIVAAMRPGLHVNLHGYPAHEWTRPLTGYVPRNFALWTVPKGFFLVVRHRPGHGDTAWRLAREVAARLCEVPGLVAFNERQIALYRIHAGELGFEIVSGFPVTVTEHEGHSAPVTLITEYPDETIYGEAFRLGVEAQATTVVAAYESWQAIVGDETPTS